MKSISTKSVVSGQWSVVRTDGPRGTAEIELLFVIPILLTILFLAGGALSLGAARLANVFNAGNKAYTQSVGGLGFTPSLDPLPIDGINALKPALPNRYVYANESMAVALESQDNSPIANLNDRAIMLDPAWHYSAWPQTFDRPQIRDWFDNYVAESHPADIVNALGLQPPGPP